MDNSKFVESGLVGGNQNNRGNVSINSSAPSNSSEAKNKKELSKRTSKYPLILSLIANVVLAIILINLVKNYQEQKAIINNKTNCMTCPATTTAEPVLAN
ncbi:MAG: hypothetical protein M1324_04185 [Patescibacteria group bacterium]|nr:hypothetical protein [Patescibacteria group bacterium]